MTFDEIKQITDTYYAPVFGERLPVAFTHGKGTKLYDTEGKEYTDFFSGIAVNALGYAHEGLTKAITAQAGKLMHCSNLYYNETQAQLADELCHRTGYQYVFFSNSGAEAMECAIKLAKKRSYDAGNKSKHFVSLADSFHGRTLATLTATGQERFHTAFAPGTYQYSYVAPNDEKAAAKQLMENDCCAFILELVQGEGGVRPLSQKYVQQVANLCEQTDTLLIIDEIQTGVGRTGSFLAQEQYGVRADVVTLAKSLGGGVPIGACLYRKEVNAFDVGDHGSTFGGNPLACAAGLFMTKAIDAPTLSCIREMGDYFFKRLQDLQQELAGAVVDVRGVGLMLGVQLSEEYPAADLMRRLLEQGFVVGTAGGNTLRLLPPYIICRDEIDSFTKCLQKTIDKMGENV